MSTKITFGAAYQDKLPHQKLFSEFESKLVGQPSGSKDELRLYIVKEALEKMWDHVQEESGLECAGVLAGQASFDPEAEITFTVITDIVRNNSVDRGVGHVHVSTEAARVARKQIEQRNMRPVGWYHSHPTQGIFLSGDDMRIVKGIYNASWQVALVFDPKRKTVGVFQGGNGKNLPGYLLLKDNPLEARLMALYRQAIKYLKTEQLREAFQAFATLIGLAEDLEELSRYPNAQETTNVLEQFKQSLDNDRFADAWLALETLFSIWPELRDRKSRLQRAIERQALAEQQRPESLTETHSLTQESSALDKTRPVRIVGRPGGTDILIQNDVLGQDKTRPTMTETTPLPETLKSYADVDEFLNNLKQQADQRDRERIRERARKR